MKKFHKQISALLLVGSLLSGCGVSENSISGSKVQETSSVLMQMTVEDEAAIRNVLYDHYLGGQKQQSAALIQKAFHKDSVMMLPVVDDAGKSTLKKWLDMHKEVSSWASPGNPSLDFENFEVLSMSIIDQRMAQVMFKYNDMVFDAITLVKIQDEWVIAAKVFIPQDEG